jgi:dihydroorotase
LEGFASHFGADFYAVARNTETVTLLKQPWRVPAEFPLGTDSVVPLRAGAELAWRLA